MMLAAGGELNRPMVDAVARFMYQLTRWCASWGPRWITAWRLALPLPSKWQLLVGRGGARGDADPADGGSARHAQFQRSDRCWPLVSSLRAARGAAR
ncbi:hypothetical protein MJJ08_18545 [Xanthomonas oryzae]|uniref:hypothetical protein n=1 Tax=Xanthomonas oryzae TaxID=347 RepID=UPI0023AEB295|nr:hypothetical protein [Xanthomonas oryzae]WEE97151.1 hypothetical protein MJJ08_18545 [Xanthomonas oryzae]